MYSPTIFYHSLTILAQSLATCANVMAVTRNFVALSSITCMAWCDNKFMLPASPIAENLCRCDRALCTTCKGKEAPYGCSYNDEWFLVSQMVTYYLWWVLWYFKEFKNAKLDKWQKMLLSLRSNPQTMSPYIQKSDGLCTRTDHHMLLPIVLHMVVPLCYE